MVKKLRIGVLASGSGTDLQSVIDASENNMINAHVVVVISDKPNAFCLKRAEKHKINCCFIDSKGLNREDFDKKIDKILIEEKVDLVVGAGYMKILSKCFIRKWYGKIINIHPALLPSFKGVNAQGDAIEHGVKISGCTTHFMNEEMDSGPIILQAAVKIMPGDNREEIAARILEVEHQILPRTIDLFEKGYLKINGQKVEITKDDSWKDKYMFFPDVLYSEGY